MPSLEFTLMAGCPLMCTFCPQDKLKAAYGTADKYMSVTAFRTILAKLPKHVRVDFSGMAEPWANPCATEMLGLTLDQGYNVAIYTTLYGMDDGALVAGMLQHHRDQIEVVCLHLPDANGNMRGWKYSQAYETNLRRFIAMRDIIPLQIMTMDGSGRVHPDLARVGIYLDRWTGHTRAGNIEAPDGQKIEAPPRHDAAVMCSFTPLYDQNVVLPDGSVVLCCMDYSARHRIGNLLEQDYYEIFSGPGMGELRSENMQPKFSERSLCRTCNRATQLTTGPANRLMWRASL
jgi:hypothetical protein